MRRGYTIFELMVVILMVTSLATAVGMFVVNLLTIQEQDREEAYIREKLTDLCAEYADLASIGSSFSIANKANIVSYRQETGGLSLETGRVSRAAYLTVATTNRTLDLSVYSFDLMKTPNQKTQSRIFSNIKQGLVPSLTRMIHGDATLLAIPTNKVDIQKVTCSITPLKWGISVENPVPDPNFDGFNIYSNTAFGNLKIEAWYIYRNGRRDHVLTNAVAERLVRLWNHD